MEKFLEISAFVVLVSALTCCKATTFMVGDNSGWDISTNLATWPIDKTFNVGDVLVFQYSSSHSVSEVTKESFDSCNTTNVLRTYTSGNATVTLTKPGDNYFVCGNKLHCLGGMKLKVTAQGNQTDPPVGSPQASTSSDPGTTDNSDLSNPSSKTNKQIPSSNASFSLCDKGKAIGLAFLSVFVSLLINV